MSDSLSIQLFGLQAIATGRFAIVALIILVVALMGVRLLSRWRNDSSSKRGDR